MGRKACQVTPWFFRKHLFLTETLPTFQMDSNSQVSEWSLLFSFKTHDYEWFISLRSTSAHLELLLTPQETS